LERGWANGTLILSLGCRRFVRPQFEASPDPSGAERISTFVPSEFPGSSCDRRWCSGRASTLRRLNDSPDTRPYSGSTDPSCFQALRRWLRPPVAQRAVETVSVEGPNLRGSGHALGGSHDVLPSIRGPPVESPASCEASREGHPPRITPRTDTERELSLSPGCASLRLEYRFLARSRNPRRARIPVTSTWVSVTREAVREHRAVRARCRCPHPRETSAVPDRNFETESSETDGVPNVSAEAGVCYCDDDRYSQSANPSDPEAVRERPANRPSIDRGGSSVVAVICLL
jgi:hypothetical protein